MENQTILASIINEDGDIEIFLSDKAVSDLKKKSLKGEIFELRNIKKCYPLEILLENKEEWLKYKRTTGGIYVCRKNEKYSIYIDDVIPATSHYRNLVETGAIGGRPLGCGDIKIDIIKESYAKQDLLFSRDLKVITRLDKLRKESKSVK